MRFTEKQILLAGDMSLTSVASIGLSLQQIKDWSIQAVWTGSPVGTMKIQISNDDVQPGNDGDPAAHVVNWTDYTGSSQAINGAGDFGWLAQNSGYQWVRLLYTTTSGTGSLSAMFSGKEL